MVNNLREVNPYEGDPMEGNKIKAKVKPEELLEVSLNGLVPAIKN